MATSRWDETEAAAARQPVAVVGIALKFPQDISSAEDFWQMLMNGRCAATGIPKERMNANAFHGSGENNFDTFSPQGGHFLNDDVAAFDAPFFSIPPTEAATMDPQQRGLLETAYLAIENAGITLDRVSGSKTSVFTGCFTDDYKMMYASDPEQSSLYGMTGVSSSLLANRISWFFNLTGSSANIDTACSSSLMALDIACQNLLSGESNMSLVAGCNLILSPATMLLLDNQNLLSKHGRSYSFDKRADGYARGEGFSALVLKRLSDAVKDGDTIRAIIRSTHSNQNGHTTAGITRTSRTAQENLIREAYKKAGLSMEPTKYVEAHGTGTRLGDAFEANAIGDTFRKGRKSKEPLYIGAVKSNIGHLEGGSGLAGLIKAVLVLEHAIIPPNANYDEPNPRIDTEMLNIKFPLQPVPWPNTGLRRTSISGMGFGGSNIHVVLDDAYHFLVEHEMTGNHNTVIHPPTREEMQLLSEKPSSCHEFNVSKHHNHCAPKSKSRLLVWSASDKNSLQRSIASCVQHCEALASKLDATDAEEYLSDLAYTLSNRRSSFAWKSFVAVESLKDLFQVETTPPSATLSMSTPPRIGLVFTGQGAQWFGMGQELRVYPVFHDSLVKSAKVLNELGCEWDLLYELYEAPEPRVNLPEFSQPLCTAVQIALVDLINSFDIVASAVVGHSSGEIAAAYCIGALSQASAMKVAYFRGTQAKILTEKDATRGTMIAVRLAPEEAKVYLEEVAVIHGSLDLTIACYNSQSSITISGDRSQIDTLHSILTEAKQQSQILKVDVAYHSSHMVKISESYRSLIQELERGSSPRQHISMVSSVTGEKVNPEDLCTSDYWVRNLVSPVKFDKALSMICNPSSRSKRRKIDNSHERALFVEILVEVGPHAALRGPVNDTIQQLSSSQTYVSLLIRNMSASRTLQDVAGRLHCAGYPVNLDQVNQLGLRKSKVLSDLPGYSFDHSQKYWFESRISKGIRFGAHAKNRLLGKPVADWNPLDARWRNFIKASDLPWIEDHKVQGIILYPAAGMIVMALEAARQLAGEGRHISAFRVEQVKFDAPLVIRSTATEVQVSLRPKHAQSVDSYDQDTISFDFVIYSYVDEKWTQNASGTVDVIYKDQQATAQIGDSAISDTSNQSQMDTTSFYRTLRDSGYEYGPSFQVVKSASKGINESTGEVQVFRDSAEAHVIHPTTLDGILHLIFASYTDGGKRTMDTLLPVQIKSLWMSSSGLGYDSDVASPFNLAYVSARKHETTYLGSETDILVSTELGGPLLARIEGFKLQKMTTTTSSIDSSALATSPLKLCRKLEWRPDISFLDTHEISKLCRTRSKGYEEHTEFFRSLDRLINLFLRRALHKMNAAQYDIAQLPPHIQRYVEWIKRVVRTDESKIGEDTDIESLSKTIREANDYGKLLVTVGKNLSELITGQIDRLSFFFQTDPDLLPAAYLSLNQISNFMQPLHTYLDHIAHLDPSMKALEVGAGTGGTTTSVLDALTSRSGGPRYGQYDFTDLSPAFFETAREKFREFRRVEYKVFDAERDPMEQGYTTHSYDLVIASNVLHATRSLADTLQHVRSLLKPGGKLILMEMIRPDIPRFGFAFGLLEGWWLGINDSREWSPCISEEKWNEVLGENGFSGNNLILRDFENDSCHQMSVIVSTAITSTPSEENFSEFDLVLLVGDESEISSQSTSNIQSRLKTFGMTVDGIVTLQQASETRHAPGRTIYISLLDLKRPFLRTMSAEDFANLQGLLQSAKGILWVSGLVSTPECGMIDGLARVIRGESNKLVLVTVSLETDDGILSERQISHLQKIMQRTPWDTLSSDYETAFVESHGTIEVGRIEDDDDLSQQIIDYSLPNKSTIQKWAECSHLEMKVENPGLLDTLYFAEADVNTEPLAMDEIEVNVEASGIIFRDVLTALGKLDGGYLGLECAGVVTRVGENSDFQVGQRVCGLAPGSSSSHIRMNRHCAMAIPPGMSFTEAASLPVAFYTAYCTLESARIRKGESILIHSAAGATGQAAIQLSRHFGISEIYATVGTEEKKQLLIDHYGIPETHIFSSRDTDFAEHIKRSTKNGVDIVLNSLSGKGLLASWDCLAPYGRFLEIGKSDIIANNSLPMQQFLRNVTFSAFDLSTLVTERPERLADATKALERLWIEKKLRLVTPLHVFPVSQAEDALRLLQSGKSSGKIVLEMLPDSLVKVISTKESKELFRADRTYVVVGGLGGLGRSIARWMATRGAKNLLLLSRSGPKIEAALELIKDLETKGVTVRAPVCDTANPASIKAVLADYATNLPPIAGCIQAAMVLRDSLFEKMSFPDWKTALAPKVTGSWNLHKLLPSPLDFFIMLSSTCGILGQVGQANYATGNTYQDALARYRVSQGEHGISIDLGAMMLEGYVSENEEVSKRLLESGYFHPLTQDNLFGLLEHFCDSSVKLTPTDSQIIFGLARPSTMLTEEILAESRIASPLFRSMHTQDSNSNSSSQLPTSSTPELNDFKQNFVSAPSIAEAGAIVTTELVKKLSRNLPSMSSGKVDLWQPMMAYGVDSLLSVELRSWFAREFVADVGIFETMNGSTFSSIGLTVARNSRWRSSRKEE